MDPAAREEASRIYARLMADELQAQQRCEALLVKRDMLHKAGQRASAEELERKLTRAYNEYRQAAKRVRDFDLGRL